MLQILLKMFKLILNKTERLKNKASKFVEFEKSLKQIDEELSERGEDFQIKKSEYDKSLLLAENDFVKGRMKEKHNAFIMSHLSTLGELKKQKESILKSMNNLYKDDEEFVKAVQEDKQYKAFNSILKSYRDDLIDLNKCDDIIKATSKNKVKYADNIVCNEQGQILLLRRSEHDSTFPGMYVVPGGHVDMGEDCETAAKRELYEEAGIKVEKVDQVGEYENEKVHIKYYQSYVNNVEPVLQQEEAWGYEWVNIDDLQDYEMPLNMCENLLKILRPFKYNVIKIKKSFESGLLNETQYKGLLSNLIEKARSGVYKDTPYNRKHGLVGQKYGSKKEEESGEKYIGENYHQLKNWLVENGFEKRYVAKSGSSSYWGNGLIEVRLSDHKNQSIHHDDSDINGFSDKKDGWKDKVKEIEKLNQEAKVKGKEIDKRKNEKLKNLSGNKEWVNHPEFKEGIVQGEKDGKLIVVFRSGKKELGEDEVLKLKRDILKSVNIENTSDLRRESLEKKTKDLNSTDEKYKKKLKALKERRDPDNIESDEYYKSEDKEPEFTKEQLKEMIQEHKRLVKVLENDKSEENKKEYETQKKELDEYVEKMKQYKSSESDILKAWESAQIGEVRTHADGKKYKKVNNTGDKNKDWKLVTNPKNKQEGNGNVPQKGDNVGNKEGKQQSEANLSEAAKNASETNLNNAIKESDDPNIREAAHQELDRRENEEKVQEEEKGETPSSEGQEKKEADLETKNGSIDLTGRFVKADEVKTGQPVKITFAHNPTKNPVKYKKAFAQDIEPHGKYLINTDGKYKIEGHEYGDIEFKNPLVVEHKTTDSSGWKGDLVNKFGKKGKQLSKELIKIGYDGIITVDSGKYNDLSEIVSLKDFDENYKDKRKSVDF